MTHQTNKKANAQKTDGLLLVQVEKLKAEAAAQQAEVARLHGTTVQQLYLEDLDAFLQAYEAWEADEAANSGLLAEMPEKLLSLNRPIPRDYDRV